MIIFDTETTGFITSTEAPIATQPKIIEIFALKVDDETLEEICSLSMLIDPKDSITEEITRITSITNEMVKGAGDFASHFHAISNFWLGERAVGGHNATFDCDMLEVECRRLGRVAKFPWTPHRLCSVEMTEHYFGRRMKLIDLYTHLFGEGFEKAHRAEPDVRATHRVFRELKKRGDLAAF